MCERKHDVTMLLNGEQSMTGAMCGVQLLYDRRSVMDMMLMLYLNESIDQLAMATSVHWYGPVLRMEDGHVLRRQDGDVMVGWSCDEMVGWSCDEMVVWSCVEMVGW